MVTLVPAIDNRHATRYASHMRILHAWRTHVLEWLHHLIDSLQVASRGCSVHGIVRYRTHWGNLAGMLDGSIVFHKGDITDAAFVRFA